MKRYCETVETSTYGINRYFIIHNNKPILDCFDKLNRKQQAKDISTYDFHQIIYTKVQHDEIFTAFQYILNVAFHLHSDGESVRAR